MQRQHRHEVDDDEEEGRERGRHVKVPLTLMDGVQLSVAAEAAQRGQQLPPHEQRVLDHQARLETYRHLGETYGTKPGPLPVTDEQRRAGAEAYRQHVEALSQAWRGAETRPPAADAQPQRPQQPRLRTNDAEAAHAEMVERVQNAWRRTAA
jgi:hypothetical protein